MSALASRRFARLASVALGVALVAVVAAGCGGTTNPTSAGEPDPVPAETSNSGATTDDAGVSPGTTDPGGDPADGSDPAGDTPVAPARDDVDLTALAEQIRADLGVEAERLGRSWSPIIDVAGETWWARIPVEVELTEADLDDPLATLPAPLDKLTSAVAELHVRADSPLGPVGTRLRSPFSGLRATLDGSEQPVTTEPGDDPPSTSTWPVAAARIVGISLTVGAIDDAGLADEVLAAFGADQIRLGPPETMAFLTVAEAMGGTTATLPPSTGTTVPAPTG